MKQSEWEKQMYKFAYECAIKGIDIEETLGNFINTYKDVVEIIIKQTTKNYNYLLKYREPKEELEEIEFAKAGDLMITIVNKLIENQNKIVREMKANKKQ